MGDAVVGVTEDLLAVRRDFGAEVKFEFEGAVGAAEFGGIGDDAARSGAGADLGAEGRSRRKGDEGSEEKDKATQERWIHGQSAGGSAQSVWVINEDDRGRSVTGV